MQLIVTTWLPGRNMLVRTIASRDGIVSMITIRMIAMTNQRGKVYTQKKRSIEALLSPMLLFSGVALLGAVNTIHAVETWSQQLHLSFAVRLADSLDVVIHTDDRLGFSDFSHDCLLLIYGSKNGAKIAFLFDIRIILGNKKV